ncbi:MAG: hypothetical protein RLZZ502_610 [Pseudomonadota bacterium]|jgi:drug/metabolite transporter (DMT)-like permease
MNRKFVLGSLCLFVLWMIGSFIVHAQLLAQDYAALTGKLFRTPADSEKYFPFMLLAHAFMSCALMWIYARGNDILKPWLGQGLRFGVAVAFLACIPTYLIYYAVQPTPGELVAKQIIFDGVLLVLLGVFTSWWQRKPSAE